MVIVHFARSRLTFVPITLCSAGTAVYKLVDAVLLQTCNTSVRCRYPPRSLWKTHSLFECIQNIVLYLPHRNAYLLIGRGVGVICAERVIELVRDVQFRVRS